MIEIRTGATWPGSLKWRERIAVKKDIPSSPKWQRTAVAPVAQRSTYHKLNKVLELAKNGLLDVLVVRELDRLSRDVGKLYIAEKELRHFWVNIEYILYAFHNDPAGQLMKNIYASFAQFEREEIKIRMMRGHQNSVRQGKVLVSNSGPYGYKKVKDDRRIFFGPDPQTAPVVKVIFTWYAVNQFPICHIKDILDKSCAPIPEAFGRKHSGGWPKTTIRRILRSSTYVGEWTYTITGGETLTVKVPSIIDRGVWEAAQATLDENKALSVRYTRHQYLFGHHIICGKWGQYLVRHPQYAGEKVYLYYSWGAEKHDHT
jgi:site-specific DNA recombinase